MTHQGISQLRLDPTEGRYRLDSHPAVGYSHIASIVVGKFRRSSPLPKTPLNDSIQYIQKPLATLHGSRAARGPSILGCPLVVHPSGTGSTLGPPQQPSLSTASITATPCVSLDLGPRPCCHHQLSLSLSVLKSSPLPLTDTFWDEYQSTSDVGDDLPQSTLSFVVRLQRWSQNHRIDCPPCHSAADNTQLRRIGATLLPRSRLRPYLNAAPRVVIKRDSISPCRSGVDICLRRARALWKRRSISETFFRLDRSKSSDRHHQHPLYKLPSLSQRHLRRHGIHNV